MAVHDHQFDRAATLVNGVVEGRAVEIVGQGFGAERGEYLVLQHVAGVPQHQAKAARIAQAHHFVVRQHQIKVVMLFDGRIAIHQPQAAGHTEMHNQRAGAAINQ